MPLLERAGSNENLRARPLYHLSYNRAVNHIPLTTYKPCTDSCTLTLRSPPKKSIRGATIDSAFVYENEPVWRFSADLKTEFGPGPHITLCSGFRELEVIENRDSGESASMKDSRRRGCAPFSVSDQALLGPPKSWRCRRLARVAAEA